MAIVFDHPQRTSRSWPDRTSIGSAGISGVDGNIYYLYHAHSCDWSALKLLVCNMRQGPTHRQIGLPENDSTGVHKLQFRVNDHTQSQTKNRMRTLPTMVMLYLGLESTSARLPHVVGSARSGPVAILSFQNHSSIRRLARVSSERQDTPSARLEYHVAALSKRHLPALGPIRLPNNGASPSERSQ
jgi:hypothetical protein